MLKITNIRKTYMTPQLASPQDYVLKGINLEILPGEIFGLIGANGAGKTTLMNIISQITCASGHTVITPEGLRVFEKPGTIEIDGEEIKDLNSLKGKVGYMLDIPASHEFMTAMEYLAYLSAPQGLSKEETTEQNLKLLESVGLTYAKDRRIKGYSRGMKQKMGIAAGLVTNPKVVLMDEPSSALDPQGRHEVIEIIKNLAKEGKVVMLSTHVLSDVEKVCTRVGFLIGGEIKITGPIKEVTQSFNEDAYRIVCKDSIHNMKIVEAAKKAKGFKEAKIKKDGSDVLVFFKEGGRVDILKAIVASGIEIDSISLKQASMEDIFLQTNVRG
ncbi:MAG: ABC transporter ATP-binding protein [Firmicutes bacterium]|nr:ABC transporter ATP-binding protein [Bacillota bacterium]MCL2771283.1 ABC transporter ATP-binding protein [Bacillota bacterium]